MKLKNIEAIGTGENLRDSLENWRTGLHIIVIWIAVLTVGVLYLFMM